MYYYVYWITCKVNGRHYIGSKADHKIPEESNYMGSSRSLREDIKKYGKENFYKHIVKEFGCEKECRAEEGRLHDLYDVGKNPLFYNATKASKNGWENSGKHHHGFGDIDWEGISTKDRRKYLEIRKLLDKELEPISISGQSAEWINTNVLTPEEEFDKLNIDDLLNLIFEVKCEIKINNINEKWERNNYILEQYYIEGKTLEMIGQEHDITRECVSAILRQQIRRIKTKPTIKKLNIVWEDYLMQKSEKTSFLS